MLPSFSLPVKNCVKVHLSLSTENFQYRSKYACGCCLKQPLLLHLLCCVHCDMWYFMLGIRCLGLWRTPNWCTHFFTRFTGCFPSFGSFTQKTSAYHPHPHPRKKNKQKKQNGSQHMCNFVCTSTLRFTVAGSEKQNKTKSWDLN